MRSWLAMARRPRVRRLLAGLLLVLVVVLLLVNPLWECHDHMDNLRHLGPHGILVLFLLFACAGMTLFRAVCWLSPDVGSTPLPSLSAWTAGLERACADLPAFLAADLSLSIRV